MSQKNSQNYKEIKGSPDLSYCLINLLSNNNEKRGFVERSLIRFCQSPVCLKAFAFQIRFSKEVEVRHIAAVLLRKLIQDMWETKFAKEKTKNDIKGVLLYQLSNEKSYIVRRALIYCIGEICRTDVQPEENKWPKIMQYVSFQFKNKTDLNTRMNVIFLMEMMIEKSPDFMFYSKKSTTNFVNLFRTTFASIKHPKIYQTLVSACVQVFRAAAAYSMHEVETYRHEDVVCTLFDDLFNALKMGLRNVSDNQSIIELTLEAFSWSVQIKSEKKNFRQKLCEVFTIMLKISLNNMSLPNVIHNAINNIICQFVQFNQGIIVDNKLFGPLINYMHSYLKCPEKEVDMSNEMANTKYKFGAFLLVTMCENITDEYIFDLLFKLASVDTENKDDNVKRAGITIFAYLTGYSERMHSCIRTVLNKALKVYNNGSPQARLAVVELCLQAISYNDVISHHDKMLPFFLKVLSDTNEQVVTRCVDVLGIYIDFLPVGEENIWKHSKVLLERIINLFPKSSLTLQNVLVLAIKALVNNMQAECVSMVKSVQDLLLNVISKHRNSRVELTCSSIVCLGYLSYTMDGNDRVKLVKRHLPIILDIASKVPDLEVQISCVACLTRYVISLGEKISIFADPILKLCQKHTVLSSCDIIMNRESSFLNRGKKFMLVKKVDELLKMGYMIHPNKNNQRLKAEVIQIIGIFSREMKTGFLKYVKIFWKFISNEAMDIFNDLGRKAAYVSMTNIVTNIYPNITQNNKNANNMKDLFQVVAKLTVQLTSDPMRENVETIIKQFDIIMQKYGLFAINHVYDELAMSLCSLIMRKGKCFNHIDKSVSLRYENSLFSPLMTTLETFISLGKKRFEKFFRSLYRTMVNYLMHSDPRYRYMMIGSLGDWCKAMGKQSLECFRGFVDLALNLVRKDGDLRVKRNAIYFLNSIFDVDMKFYNDKTFARMMNDSFTIMSKKNVFKDAWLLDNACAQMARLIHSRRLKKKFVIKLAPIFLSWLPLKVDQEEWEQIVKALLELFRTRFDIMKKGGMIPALQTFYIALRSGRLSKDVGNNVVKLLKQLSIQQADVLRNALNRLSNKEKAFYQKFFNNMNSKKN